jgi:hypothetical protein
VSTDTTAPVVVDRHPPPDKGGADSLTNLFDYSASFMPDDQALPFTDLFPALSKSMEIATAYPGRFHLNDDLPRPGHRIGYLPYFDSLISERNYTAHASTS